MTDVTKAIVRFGCGSLSAMAIVHQPFRSAVQQSDLVRKVHCHVRVVGSSWRMWKLVL